MYKRQLQGRLPYIFRFLGIDTIEKANAFLVDFVDGFNARFAVPAQSKELHWETPPPDKDFNFLFSVRANKNTRADGTFIYHGYKFRLLAKKAARMRFTLCLSECYGIKAYMLGKYYDIELAEPMCDVISDRMPAIEKDLIYRYLLADTHSGRAVIRAG